MGFSKKSIVAAAVYQDVDASVMEADHIRPRSKGGTDDVANCQLLPPEANRMKSDKFRELRAWQTQFLMQWDAHSGKTFLLAAIPGGGKTVAALTAARRFLDAANDRRVIVVVPTVNLREQWRAEAVGFGIQLQTKEFGTNFKAGFTGGVITYQSLDGNAALLRKICGTTDVLVVMDEPHHCGDKESWGASAKVAFELSRRMLLLSGTPFRTDGQPIPFVQYDNDGVCIADYRYDCPGALVDRVVRHLVFDYSRGEFTLSEGGTEKTYDLHAELSEDESSFRLRKILSASSGQCGFVEEQIAKAHEKLCQVRQTIPDAGAMAVCMDQQHARDVATVIRRITGKDPAIIVSDEDIATDDVRRFKKSSREWCVSVRQVSEGTDIKRLQVLCYLTNATTELFFRQLIGRVSRVRYPNDNGSRTASEEQDREAYVFLPADRRLIEHAEQICSMQMKALKIEAEEHERREQADRQANVDPSFFLRSAHHGTQTMVIGDVRFDSKASSAIRHVANKYGINSEVAARMYIDRDTLFQMESPAPPMDHTEEPPVSLEEKITSMRKQCQDMVNRLVRLTQESQKDIHGRFPPQKHMSLSDLEKKLRTLTQWHKEERSRRATQSN